MFYIEVRWNRETLYTSYGSPFSHLSEAILRAKALANSGDGARVKNVRIWSEETGDYVWADGKETVR